ncbi:MerR family DNA-binding protein [Aliiroseovarius sp.]|uniref:MerR family DNA-binding protein n=1 Tax=Aliiroseovarius sp. TaxID=1872442 RepID=UPI0026194B54|nr:MerR family DNA-binding protein [Aliiroseovarius sp.]
MNIGEVSDRSGLPAKTIRYYEEIGLIEIPRDPNGYRRFGQGELEQLSFLSRARGLGFSIDDCRALLRLLRDAERASADVKTIATRHLEAIERKIRDLSTMRETLTELVDSCVGDHSPQCEILDRLSRI